MSKLELTVTLVLLAIKDDALHVVTKRDQLPGDWLQPHDSLEWTASMACWVDTGAEIPPEDLRLLGVYSAPNRCFGHSREIAVAYLGILSNVQVASLEGVAPYPVHLRRTDDVLNESLDLDHNSILKDGLKHAQCLLETTNLAAQFCAPIFTLAELRRVYELLLDTTLDPANFRRKMLSSGNIEELGKRQEHGSKGGRPATTYRVMLKNPAKISE